MVFGNQGKHWPDIEADEATFGKKLLADGRVAWKIYY